MYVEARISDSNVTGVTLKLMNFLNVLTTLPFLELSIIILGIFRSELLSWSANSIEPGQTVQMFWLAWLYTSGKGWSLTVPAG